MRRWTLLGLVAVAAVAGAAALSCGDDDEGAAEVDVALQEFSVVPSVGSVQAGEVTFNAENVGPDDPHELVVIKTELAADALPVAGGKVDEDAAGEEIGEVEEFPGGEIEVATFNLEAGRYAFICNIAGHYEQGMYAEVTVG